MTIAQAPTVSEPTETPRLQLVEAAAVPAPSPAAVSLARRLRLAIDDLGLDRIVGTGWVSPCSDGLGFTPLTVRSADRLVRRLEDLAVPADWRTIEREDADDADEPDPFGDAQDGTRGVAPVYEQLTLFDPSPWDVSLHDRAAASDADAIR